MSEAASGTSDSGLLVVYTGQGKGKTTAALGAVFRALGRGLAVAVVQFIKGKWKTGERTFAESLPQLTFLVMGRGFTWESDDLSRDRQAAVAAWQEAARLIAALTARPRHVHVVITGRNAPAALMELADTVTDMVKVKHPFDGGRKAAIGLDY